MYRLTETALKAIQQQTPGIKSRLAFALGCSEGTINRYLRKNHDNLTKAASVSVIRESTGLTDEEILERPGKTCVEQPADSYVSKMEMVFHFKLKKE